MQLYVRLFILYVTFMNAGICIRRKERERQPLPDATSLRDVLLPVPGHLQPAQGHWALQRPPGPVLVRQGAGRVLCLHIRRLSGQRQPLRHAALLSEPLHEGHGRSGPPPWQRHRPRCGHLQLGDETGALHPGHTRLVLRSGAGRVDTRLSFVQNSREFHAKRVSDVAKNIPCFAKHEFLDFSMRNQRNETLLTWPAKQKKINENNFQRDYMVS